MILFDVCLIYGHLLHAFLSLQLLLTSHNILFFSTVWAAQAGAKRVYAIEYTDMANHARRVVKANGVEHIVTVIQGAVEDVILPQEDWDGIGIDGGLGLGGLTLEEGDVDVNVDGRKNQRVVDIILSGECVSMCFFFLSRAVVLPAIAAAVLPAIARSTDVPQFTV